MIEIIGKRSDFRPMFNRYIEAYDKYMHDYYSRVSSRGNFADLFGYDDDDYSDYWDNWDDYGGTYDDDSWINQYWEGVKDRYWKNKNGKHKTRSSDYVSKGSKTKNKGKKHRYSDVPSNKNDLRGSYKCIRFYWDVNNPDENMEMFENVFEFDKYLTEQGISVSADNVDKLLENDDSYCCLSPVTLDGNANELLVGDTFGDLSWKYADLYNDCIPSASAKS